MKKQSNVILVFAVAFTVFFLTPVILGKPFPLNPLMKISDVFDLFTPLVLIPLYWLLFRAVTDEPPTLKETILFLVLAAVWVEGQGIHLAANSIGHWFEGMEGAYFYQVAYFYDEVLGHYIWHAGVIGLSGLILWRQWRNPYVDGILSLWLPVVAGLLHGLTFFLIIVEGQTTPIGVPFAAAVALFIPVFGGNRIKKQPVLLFFFVAYVIATLLLAGWRIYWGAYLEPSVVWGL
jgi:hypothetical protein